MATLHTDDGIEIYYESAGNGEPIVFVHEFGGDYRSWYRQVPVFSQTHQCILYSARGFLPSAVPKDRNCYGQEHATNDLLALADHLQLNTAHFVGTSMGSFTSLDFALSHPDRVKTLTLIGNSSGPREKSEQISYRENWIGHEVQLRRLEGPDGAVKVLEGDPAYQRFRREDPEGWARYSAHLRGQSVEGAVHILSTVHWNRRSLFDDQQRLAAFDKPVLLLTGVEDYYLVAETNAYLHATFPNATRHDFEGTGHLVNLEQAATFNAILAAFLGRSP